MPSKRPTPHFKEGFKRANVDPVSSAIYTYDTKNVKPISPAAPATQQFLHNSNATATTQQVPNCYATATQQLPNSSPTAATATQQLRERNSTPTQQVPNSYATATQQLRNKVYPRSTYYATRTQQLRATQLVPRNSYCEAAITPQLNTSY